MKIKKLKTKIKYLKGRKIIKFSNYFKIKDN